MYCALTCSRSGRNPAGGGGRNADLLSGPKRWALSAAHGRWLARVQLASILGTVETFFPSLKKREYQTPNLPVSPVLPVLFFEAGPPLEGAAVQSPPLRLSRGPLQGMSLIIHIGSILGDISGRGMPYDATRKYP